MRRLALIAAALLALAAPALAQDKGRITVVRPATGVGLRPALAANGADPQGAALGRRPAPSLQSANTAAGAAARSASALALIAPTPLIATPIASPSDPGQCRAVCAQTYYFCAAGGDGEDCSATWGQCRAGCGPAASWRTPIGLSGR